MRKVDETWLLRVISLAYAIDKCIEEITDSDSMWLEVASALSEMQIELIGEEKND